MAHRKNRFCNTYSCTYFKNTIEERNQCRQTFKRKPLRPQVPRLSHLLEEIGANKLSKNMSLIRSRSRTLHLLLNPLSPLRIGNMHELDSNGLAVKAPRLRCILPLGSRNRKSLRRKELPKRIKRSLKISPSSEYLKSALTFATVRS